jgi:hypothetical protein
MRARSLKFGLALGLGIALLAGDAFAAEIARPQAISGRVTVNKGARVGPDTQLKQGDSIEVASGARITIAFEDGCQLDVAGPAKLELTEIGEGGRKVKLVSGMITQAFVRGIALGIMTDYGAELVLQNATAAARVAPGDRLTFSRRDGSYLKVYEGTASQDLKTEWSKSLRAPGAKPARKPGAKTATKWARFTLGNRAITYQPASAFTKEDLEGGGTKLTYNGDDYGRVDIGIGTVLFLGNGESVVLDGTGHVTRFDGVAHVYHPIDEFSWYEEPIENVSDASVAYPRGR